MLVRNIAYYSSHQYPRGRGKLSPGLQGIRGPKIIVIPDDY